MVVYAHCTVKSALIPIIFALTVANTVMIAGSFIKNKKSKADEVEGD